MIDEQNVYDLTESIFSLMLDVQCEQAPTDESTDAACTGNSTVGCIHICGEWNGAVQVFTSKEMAQKAASQMLMSPVEDVTAEEIRDTISEITNMVGGSIKGVLPGPSSLSLPSVASGKDLDFEVPGSEIMVETSVICDGAPVRVVVRKNSQ